MSSSTQPLRSLPAMLYGTAWKKDNTKPLVKQALQAGFRGIDVATQPKHYNQPAVGEAVSELISAGLVSRGSLWLQTKFTSLDGQDLSQPLPYDANAPLDVQVKQSLESSLRELQTDYIDSLVMHSPMRTLEATMDVWRVFEDLVRSGRVRHLGISNLYTPAALDAVIRLADIKPSFLQNRFFAQTDWDRDVLRVCKQHSIGYQSFWTLTANPRLLASPELTSIAERYRLSAPQTLFRFLISVGITPLSGTSSLKHAQEDLACLDSPMLAPADLDALSRKIWGPHNPLA